MSLINEALKRAEENKLNRRESEPGLSMVPANRRSRPPENHWALIMAGCVGACVIAPTLWSLLPGHGSAGEALAASAPSPVYAGAPVDAGRIAIAAHDDWAADSGKPDATVPPEKPDVTHPTPAEPTSEKPERQYVLSGIVHGPGGPSAIINGRFLRVGQSLDGAKVLRIDARTVVLHAGNKRLTLRL